MVLLYGISSPQKKYVTTVSPLAEPWLPRPFLCSFLLKGDKDGEKEALARRRDQKRRRKWNV